MKAYVGIFHAGVCAVVDCISVIEAITAIKNSAIAIMILFFIIFVLSYFSVVGRVNRIELKLLLGEPLLTETLLHSKKGYIKREKDKIICSLKNDKSIPLSDMGHKKKTK
jgi:hypothetical protein